MKSEMRTRQNNILGYLEIPRVLNTTTEIPQQKQKKQKKNNSWTPVEKPSFKEFGSLQM